MTASQQTTTAACTTKDEAATPQDVAGVPQNTFVRPSYSMLQLRPEHKRRVAGVLKIASALLVPGGIPLLIGYELYRLYNSKFPKKKQG